MCKKTIKMCMAIGLILAALAIPLAGASLGGSGGSGSGMPQNQVHNIHVGYGTANLNCDACHGFPPNTNPPAELCSACHPAPVITPVTTATPTATATPVVTATIIPGNPKSRIHNIHTGPGTAGLKCDICHGFPAQPVKTNMSATSPGYYIVCERCHAPPDMGNLVMIHLPGGCAGCHNTDAINPAHPSTKADNGTVPVVRCENCHSNPGKLTPHVNGGMYCMDCHGAGNPNISPAPTALTTTATPAGGSSGGTSPAAIQTPSPREEQLDKEIRDLKERVNRTEELQRQSDSRISWLETTIESILSWFR